MMDHVLYTDEEYKEILNTVDELTQEAEKLPYPVAKDLTISILKNFDLIHREPIARMCKLWEANVPVLYEKMKSDYTVRTLLQLYDIIDEDLHDPDLITNKKH